MMRRISGFGVLAALLNGWGAATAQTQIYMAVDGDDRATGISFEGNDKVHGPVRTFERAIDLLRASKAAKGMAGSPYIIKMMAGTYQLDHPIILDDRDSGYPAAPTKIEPLGKADVTVMGGIYVTGQTTSDLWTANLPSSTINNWPQLFIADQRRQLAGGTFSGIYHIAKGEAAIHLESPVAFPNSPKLDDMTVLVFSKWTTVRFSEARMDATRKIIHLPMALPEHLGGEGEKVKVALYSSGGVFLQPGRFALGRDRRELRYRLQAGEDAATVAAIPVLKTLLKIKGRTRPAEHIALERIRFSYTAWSAKRPMDFASQAEVHQPGAIEIENASEIKLSSLAIVHTGGAAIVARHGIDGLRIDECELADIGAGGILVGDPIDRGRKPQVLRPRHIIISQCDIRGYGRISPAATGIWLGNVTDADVSNNSIRQGYYSGISAGWSWGFKGTSLKRVRIAGNHVFNIGQGLLSDMGGIYTLGVTTDTQVMNNVIDGVHAGEYGGWGLYADEGTRNVEFTKNLISNTSSESIHLHYADNNIVANNFFRSIRNVALCATNDGFTKTIFKDNVLATGEREPWGWGCVQLGFQIKPDNDIRPSMAAIPSMYRTIAKQGGRSVPLRLTTSLPPILDTF